MLILWPRVCAACLSDRYNVLFCILHTCSIRARALWILISHFVISRYPGGEVCAVECEAQPEIYIFLLAKTTVGRDTPNVIAEPCLDCGLEDLRKKERLIWFSEGILFAAEHFKRGQRQSTKLKMGQCIHLSSHICP